MIGRRTLLAAVGGTVATALTRRAGAQGSEAPVAATNHGKVRGAVKDGVNVFKGIPYGATTTSSRFKPASPPAPWTEVRDAFEFPPMSPQPVSNPTSLFKSWGTETKAGEDCLGLNVWTPALRDGVKRPVMVWFHGGDFASSSGSRVVFDGARLARKGDVVVVTLNHRLNVFGFLYLADLAPELADSGNVGMLDLVLALQWVRDNISEFGGDPSNVTIFGQSGGGGKVSTMMAMPAGAGLFHRAIVQSGSYARNAHLEAMRPEEAIKHARTLFGALDIAPQDAVRRLSEMPVEQLVAGYAKAARAQPRPNWRPVVDGRALPSGPGWPQAPAVSANVPLLIGSTETEMTMLIGSFDPATFSLDENGLRSRLSRYFEVDDVEKVISTFAATRPNATPSDLFFAITTANSFRRGAWTHADLKAAQNAAPVYLYEIDWKTPVEDGRWGSPHSLEHAFVFDNVAVSESMVGPPTSETQKMVEQIGAAWLAFARTGNPNNSAIPNWPAYKPAERATMVFNTDSKAVNAFRDDERKVLAEVSGRGPYD